MGRSRRLLEVVYLCGIAPFMSDIVKSIYAEHVSNCALKTFQWTLSETTELRTAVGANLEGLYGEMASKLASKSLTSGSG